MAARRLAFNQLCPSSSNNGRTLRATTISARTSQFTSKGFIEPGFVIDAGVSGTLADMDSNEAANLAQIQNTRLTRWLVFLAVVQIVSPFVYHWLSTPSDALANRNWND